MEMLVRLNELSLNKLVRVGKIYEWILCPRSTLKAPIHAQSTSLSQVFLQRRLSCVLIYITTFKPNWTIIYEQNMERDPINKKISCRLIEMTDKLKKSLHIFFYFIDCGLIFCFPNFWDNSFWRIYTIWDIEDIIEDSTWQFDFELEKWVNGHKFSSWLPDTIIYKGFG